MKKLAIITTHPIQYNAPFFKLLAERRKVQPRVFYTWPQAMDGFSDRDFSKEIKWDIPLLEGYEWEAVENVSKHPSSKNWKGIDCPSLISQIGAFNPDAILVYGWKLLSHFKVMRYFKGKIPIWFTGDSTMLDEAAGWKQIIRRLTLRWIYSHVDQAFYVGANNKEYFLAHGIKDDQLRFFQHAVDNARFEDNVERKYEQQAQKWRKELGYSDEDFVVLFAGKFELKKNPLLLLEAVKQLNNSKTAQLNNSTTKPALLAGRQLNLLFVGNGPLEQELKEKSEELPYVQFLPFQNQSKMPVVYRLGNLFCLPSKGPGETWGLAVNEAMACGRPVVVSDRVGCGKDLVVDGVTGYVFHSNDAPDLKNALLAVIETGPDAIGANCISHIRDWSFVDKCIAIENAFA